MRPSAAWASQRDDALALLARNDAADALVFGSVAKGRDDDDSDLDLLLPRAHPECWRLEQELSDLLGVRVQVTEAARFEPAEQARLAAQATPIALMTLREADRSMPDPDAAARLVAALDRMGEMIAYVVDAAPGPLAAYLADRIKQFAVAKMVEEFGEQAALVLRHAPEFAAAHPEIPWRLAAGMRHRIVHGYAGVDQTLVWRIATEELPALADAVAAARVDAARAD